MPCAWRVPKRAEAPKKLTHSFTMNTFDRLLLRLSTDLESAAFIEMVRHGCRGTARESIGAVWSMRPELRW